MQSSEIRSLQTKEKNFNKQGTDLEGSDSEMEGVSLSLAEVTTASEGDSILLNFSLHDRANGRKPGEYWTSTEHGDMQ